MNRAISVTKLHLNRRVIVFSVPALILLLVILISVLIAVAIGRFGVDTTSADYVAGFRQNGGALWSFPGLLVYIGVQAVTSTFSFGMSLGTTRRAYSIGTAIYFALQACYIALLAVALYGLEILTGHWFVNAYVLDVVLLGGGNVAKLALIMFVLVFTSLSVGAVFGSLFVKAGPKGPMILAVGTALALVLLVVILAPQLGSIFAAITMWEVLVAVMAVAVLAIFGAYVSLRSVTVR